MEEVRLGLIGCGLIAERGYGPALERADGVRLAAVADPVRARCAQVAPGVPAFGSAAEMLEAGAGDVLERLCRRALLLRSPPGGPARRS